MGNTKFGSNMATDTQNIAKRTSAVVYSIVFLIHCIDFFSNFHKIFRGFSSQYILEVHIQDRFAIADVLTRKPNHSKVSKYFVFLFTFCSIRILQIVLVFFCVKTHRFRLIIEEICVLLHIS